MEALAFLSETVQLEEQSRQSSFQVQQACIFLLLKKVYPPLPPLPPLLPQKVLQPVAEGEKKKKDNFNVDILSLNFKEPVHGFAYILSFYSKQLNKLT